MYRLLRNIERLKRLLKKKDGLPVGDCRLRDRLQDEIDYISDRISFLTDVLERCSGFEKISFASLQELLEAYGQQIRSIDEGRYGYSFSLQGKRNAEVFIAHSAKQVLVKEEGSIIINSDSDTLDELYKRSEKGYLQRRIYLPDGNGGYVLQGDYIFDVQQSKDANAESWISLVVLQNGGWQRYDKMFIIDSLEDYEEEEYNDNTAFTLEAQVASYKHLGKDFCQRIKVTTLKQWDFAIDRIIQSSKPNCVPIIHLEMHGNENGDLKVNDDTYIPVADFLAKMSEVSKRCNAKVLITLAVCNGLKFYQSMTKNFGKLPCSYVIGSCQPIESGNIANRFGAFYRVLLQDTTTKVDIRRAFRKMMDVYRYDKSKEDSYKNQKFVMITEGEVYE